MTRVKKKVLWIHGYQVMPGELAIYGPHGKLLLQADAMAVLLHLAKHAKTIVSGTELLESLGASPESGPDDLVRLIQEIRECFDDHQDNPLFIQGSLVTGYQLNSTAVHCDEVTVRMRDGTLVRPNDELVEKIQHANERYDHSLHLLDDAEENSIVANDTGWWESLKRRRVFRVMGSYVVGSWLIMQITDVLSGAFPVPGWTTAAVAIALAIGFPIVIALTWAFQMTPKGVVLDVNTDKTMPIDRARVVHFFDLVIIAVLLVAVGLLSFGKFLPFLPEDSAARIAVLPFHNLGETNEDRYLSEGISDDIRSRLYEIPQFLIAARASTKALANDGLDIKTLGERLMVDHVLDGSVRRFGDRIRVVVQLVDVDSGFNRWNKTYNTTIDDILEVQNNISLYVASELEILLTKELRQTLAKNPTDNPAAYDAYLRARSYLNGPNSTENLDRALLLFGQAIDQDPNFALGYAGLCQTFIARYSATGDTVFFSAAEEKCAQALQLDAKLAQVHTALGQMYVSEGRLDEAEESFENALVIDSNSIEAFAGLGDVYAATGKPVLAEQQYRGAIDLVPGNWNGYNVLARFFVKRGQFEKAIENYSRVIAFTPDNAHAYNNLGATYYLSGDFKRAAKYYEISLELSPGRAAYSNSGTMHYYAGDFSKAAELFRKAAEEARNDYRLWGNLADAQRFVNGSELARNSYLKAISLAKAQLDVNAADQGTQTNLAFYYANIGDADSALELLERIAEKPPQDAGQEYTKALAYVLLGQNDASKQALAAALALGFPESIVAATPELSGWKSPNAEYK